MKPLIINQSDISGGAALAGFRLHQGLLAQGVNSRLLVNNAKTNQEKVSTITHKYWIERRLGRLTSTLGLNYLNLISSFDIPKHPFYQDADILNFHNLHSGYFNYLAIPTLTANKPAVFTLHDMWSFTGHCAYSYDCERWKTGCGRCPYLNIYPEIQTDKTRLEWKLKRWMYNHSNLTIVTPSHWLAEQARQSMLNRFAIYHIPYGIDTEVYQPLDRELCRALLGIPKGKYVLMFGAEKLRDSRKGGKLLIDILANLPSTLKSEIFLLIIGNGGESLSQTIDVETLNLGFVGSDRMKAIAYSASDLFILPTCADNLPLVLQESMACGTPMVSFKVGGVPDLVRPEITGHLAAQADVNDFRNGIIRLLEDKRLRAEMATNCREIAVVEYPLELQAQHYINLYQKILDPVQEASNSVHTIALEPN